VLHGNGWRQQQQQAIKRGAPRAKSQGDMPRLPCALCPQVTAPAGINAL
jgi:hypothetical protein